MGQGAEDADMAYEMIEGRGYDPDEFYGTYGEESNGRDWVPAEPPSREWKGDPACRPARPSRERDQTDRWRCLVAGCNPKLFSEDAAESHREKTGHRTAKWPVRSAEGKRKAGKRNRSGYYDRYNVGTKSADARGFTPGVRRA